MKARTFAIAVAVVSLAAVAAVGGAWATGSRAGGATTADDSIAAARFSLQVDGQEIASFSQLVGMTDGAAPEEYVSSARLKPLLPGKRRPPAVVLERAMTNSLALWQWHQAVVAGTATARKTATLVVFGADGKPVARYALLNAWPSKLEIDGLKAGSAEVLTETVTLVCESLQRVPV